MIGNNFSMNFKCFKLFNRAIIELFININVNLGVVLHLWGKKNKIILPGLSKIESILFQTMLLQVM